MEVETFRYPGLEYFEELIVNYFQNKEISIWERKGFLKLNLKGILRSSEQISRRDNFGIQAKFGQLDSRIKKK